MVKRKLAPITVANYVRLARTIVGHAIKTERAGRLTQAGDNPFADPPRIPRTERSWAEITPEKFGLMLEACGDSPTGERWRRLLMLCRWCGLRLSEAIDLRWGQIETEHNRIIVNAVVDTPATKRRRRACPIEPAKAPTGMLAEVESWRAMDANANSGGAAVGGGGVNSGRRVISPTPANPHRDIQAIIIRSGIGTYAKPFHTLRKCRQTELHAAGYSDMVVCDWMGNSGRVAREHYYRAGASSLTRRVLLRPIPIWSAVSMS